ncbi:MAG: ABC transporter ATP-binding protein [Eubacteriales bacterium]|nr:ABC transporter ATP-binding protein [Eubacteriales bacterium]
MGLINKFTRTNVEESLKKKRQENAAAVEVENLVVQYVTSTETVEAVNGISLKLEKKHTLGLVGETGAGKTTAMLALMNMVPYPPGVVKSGTVKVNGLDMRNLTPAELQTVRGSEIAMIFQDPMTSLNPVLSVGEQIAESIILHRHLTEKEAMVEAGKMLEMVGIDPNRVGEYPHQFSGGMRQRVGIAIALACNPTVLIADEPTSALDVTIQAQILRMMKDLKEKNDTALIMITHDLGVVAELCDEVAVMYAGRIVEYGKLEEVFNHTKHPYTEGLFNSLPNINSRQQKLQPIPGLMPDPSNLPEGCAFADRCAYATDACRKGNVPVHSFSETHYAQCTAYENPEFKIRRGN